MIEYNTRTTTQSIDVAVHKFPVIKIHTDLFQCFQKQEEYLLTLCCLG